MACIRAGGSHAVLFNRPALDASTWDLQETSLAWDCTTGYGPHPHRLLLGSRTSNHGDFGGNVRAEISRADEYALVESPVLLGLRCADDMDIQPLPSSNAAYRDLNGEARL